MNSSSTLLIDTQSLLDQFVEKLQSLTADDFISLDTEFTRIKTYYPMLNLIQINIENNSYLIDPMSDIDLSSFIRAFVETKACVLVFAGREDFNILATEAKKLLLPSCLPANCMDLQLMLAFLNISYSEGLQSALLTQLNVDLPKDQTMSNWIARPLSQEQIDYAANDVIYLRPLYDKLITLFEPNDKRLNWLKEEMKLFEDQSSEQVDPDKAYLSVSGAGSLNIKELNVLKYLCKKRQEYADTYDVSLNRIITSKALCPLARQSYVYEKTLCRVNMKWGAIKQYGMLVVDWHKQAKLEPVDPNLALPYDYFSTKKEYAQKIKDLRHFLIEKAESNKIKYELVGSKQIVNNYFYSQFYNQTAIITTSWYKDCIGDISL